VIGYRSSSKARQFAGAGSALQGAGKHFGEFHALQAFPESHGVALAIWSQRQVAKAGMLAGVSPSGVAMPRHIHHWKYFAHAVSLLRTLNSLAVFLQSKLSIPDLSLTARAIPAVAHPLDCEITVVSGSSERISEYTITTPSRGSKRTVMCNALIAQPAPLDMPFTITWFA
jgi:hypothetical protein